MSLKARSGEEKVAGGGRQLYTGVGMFKCVAFNPNVETIGEILGIDNAKEPQYIIEKEGITTAVLSFYMEEINTGVKYIHQFFVNNSEKISKAGVGQIVNNRGQFYYGTPQAFHTTEGAKPALEGEEELINFVQSLFNLKTGKDGDIISIDWTPIMNGDFSYFTEAVATLDSSNIIGILVGIKTADTGKSYMTGYKRAYLRTYQGVDKIAKELNDAYGAFKFDYQNDFSFKPYLNTSNTTSATAPSTAPASPWG